MIFTVEEMNLIHAMNHTNRRLAQYDIRSSIPGIEDSELKELCTKTLRKVDAMTDEEFAAVDFSVYEQDEIGFEGDGESV